MNTMLNYLVEANLALVIGLLFYKLVLEKETSFSFQRIFLLAISASALLLPLMHWESEVRNVVPSFSQMVPAYWLPEYTVGGGSEIAVDSGIKAWEIISILYFTGVIISSVFFVMQLTRLIMLIRRGKKYSEGSYHFIESGISSTFSFFNYIFLSNEDIQTQSERHHVIRHEIVHVRQLHSLDILLIHFLKIVFWFNPCVHIYKKLLVQLHEFEADARAVENQDVDTYCSLLARIALQSAGLSVANHFNNSLTIKRIQMMRTLKRNIKKWKVTVSLVILPLLFVAIACQDQIVDEISKSTISQAEMPDVVKEDMAKFKAEFPEVKFGYIEGSADEVRSNSKYVGRAVMKSYNFGEKIGVIYKDISDMNLQKDDGVFVVVEQMPEFPGGFDAMKEYLQNTLNYPDDARKSNITGTSYVQFVIDENGKVVDPGIIRSASKILDEEAIRTVALMPAWKAGMQNGKAVKTRMVLPIKFDEGFRSQGLRIMASPYVMKASVVSKTEFGKTVLTGKVVDENNKGIAGINVLVEGTSTGTVTDKNGNYELRVQKESGSLSFTFVGYESKKLSF